VAQKILQKKVDTKYFYVRNINGTIVNISNALALLDGTSNGNAIKIPLPMVYFYDILLSRNMYIYTVYLFIFF
jgi:hypothetical protein